MSRERGIYSTPNPDSFRTDREVKEKLAAEALPIHADTIPPKVDAAWFAEVASRRQEEMRHLEPRFFYAKIDYKTDSPILLACQADLHLAARGMAVEKFEEDREAILETKNVKVALLGDIVDSCWFGTGIYEQLGEPEFQHQWAHHVVKEYQDAGKLAFTLGGDHDEVWAFKRAGMSMYTALQRTIGDFPFLIGPSKVEIGVGDQGYKFGVAHKHKGSSIYSFTASGQRLERERFRGADAFVTAHEHKREVKSSDVEDWGGIRNVLYGAAGCYKHSAEDTFLAQQGHQSFVGGIAFLMMPDRHEIIGFNDIQQGVRHLKRMY